MPGRGSHPGGRPDRDGNRDDMARAARARRAGPDLRHGRVRLRNARFARCRRRRRCGCSLHFVMGIVREVIVVDAADMHAEGTFWARIYGGNVFEDEAWPSVIDAAGNLRGLSTAMDTDRRAAEPQ